jgi:hypothetical protein
MIRRERDGREKIERKRQRGEMEAKRRREEIERDS